MDIIARKFTDLDPCEPPHPDLLLTRCMFWGWKIKLTHKAPVKTAADDILKCIFQRKMHISRESSRRQPVDDLHKVPRFFAQ